MPRANSSVLTREFLLSGTQSSDFNPGFSVPGTHSSIFTRGSPLLGGNAHEKLKKNMFRYLYYQPRNCNRNLENCECQPFCIPALKISTGIRKQACSAMSAFSSENDHLEPESANFQLILFSPENSHRKPEKCKLSPMVAFQNKNKKQQVVVVPIVVVASSSSSSSSLPPPSHLSLCHFLLVFLPGVF